jgi:hypothetical protein
MNTNTNNIIGPLRIYRAPGSVAFLSCSNALKPILPKSQCWKVDPSGKFVLQIRRPQYWRIEVPNESKVEQLQIEELKDVLEKVLLFEKTPCPFRRSFTVSLPEKPRTPVKRKLWKPVERPNLATSPLSNLKKLEIAEVSKPIMPAAEPIGIPYTALPLNDIPMSTAPLVQHKTLDTNSFIETGPEFEYSMPCANFLDEAEETLDIGISAVSSLPTPPGISLANAAVPITGSQSIFAGYGGLENESHSFGDATGDTNITPRDELQPVFQSMSLEPEKMTTPRALKNCSRSITAPPILSLITSPPSKQGTNSPLRKSTIAGSDSDFSSTDSFHSVLSWHSPLAPPSPPASGESSPTLNTAYPYPHENIVLPKRLNHNRDLSELTVTPETPRALELSSLLPEMQRHSRTMSPPPLTPSLMNDNSDRSDEEKSEVTTPPTARIGIRHRATTSSNSRRRALSPLPAAVNLFSPKRRSRRLQTARHIPTAILQKTCEILLSPPSHLFQLMLKIASKIAAGEWRGVLSGYGDSVHWDFEDEYASEAWTEDDFGISLPSQQNKPMKQDAGVPGSSWEVD